MTAFLPQQDPDRLKRQRQLETVQNAYQYNYSYVSPLAMVDRVPFFDKFSIRWIEQVVEKVLHVLENHIEVEEDPVRRARLRGHLQRFSRMKRTVNRDVPGLIRVVQQAIETRFLGEQPRNLDDYGSLFRTIGLPAVARDYQEDRAFAHMRLAGPNPLMLQQISQLDDRFPVNEQHYRITLEGDSLEAAGQEGRLYLADYRLLTEVDNGNFPSKPKFVYAPLALFAVDKGSRELVPVAIQCSQEPGPDHPIFTPQDGPNWLIAKTIVEIADGNHHQTVSHLGRTHLFIEPFVIATQRQLAPRHPLGMLLRPHFDGTLWINHLAHSHLISDKGPVDRILAGTIESTRKLTVKGLQNYSFNHAMLPDTFRARGVDDPQVLPNYPYRDDSLLYWNAIRQWVSDYVNVYYHSDSDVQQDFELMGWFQELVSREGGRVHGLGQNGSLGTRDYLIDVLTLIIYTSSVQHAAVNFPQFDLMSYVPNMPLAGYAPAPTDTRGATQDDYLRMLPPLAEAELQMSLGYVLGSVCYTTLGQYGLCHFRNRHVRRSLRKFQRQLAEIGRTIGQRNQKRRPYTFLTPVGIPQSINI